MQKKLKNFPFRFEEEKKTNEKLCEENYGFDQNSPILTITVCKRKE